VGQGCAQREAEDRLTICVAVRKDEVVSARRIVPALHRSRLLTRSSHRWPHARAASFGKSRRCGGRLPSSKHGVSILQLWCTLSDACRWSTCIEPNFWDHGGQHGQESEEGKEDSQEDSQEEKEVVRRKPHGIRIASEVRRVLRSTDRWQLSPTEYPLNKH